MAKCPLCGSKLLESEMTMNGDSIIEIRCSNKRCHYFIID